MDIIIILSALAGLGLLIFLPNRIFRLCAALIFSGAVAAIVQDYADNSIAIATMVILLILSVPFALRPVKREQ
jgi:hypothetical protein